MDLVLLREHIDKLHTQDGVPGCGVAVYHHGQPVFSYTTGYADAAQTRPVDEKTLFNLYSCSKPITVAAAMQLVERGLLGLDDPVAKYLPEYAGAYVIEDGQRVTVGDTMTIRHLFTMSAGLTYDLSAPAILALREKDPDASTRQMVSALIEAPLAFRPGDRFNYSLCHDVLGAVIEVVSGQTFGDYLREHIFTPLGMTDIGFHATAQQLPRFTAQFSSPAGAVPAPTGDDTIGAFRLSKNYESGGAGLFASLETYGRFAAAMACGGVSADGARILRSETVDLIRSPQLDKVVRNDTFGCSGGAGYGYGLGVRTLVRRDGGQRSSIGEFGWDGAAGSYVLMDPAEQVAIVYLQAVFDWGSRFGDMHAAIRDLTYEGLGL